MTTEFITLMDENENRKKVERGRPKLKRCRRQGLFLPSAFNLLS